MNSNFAERLKEYLESECSDYGMKYKWLWDEDYNWCNVTISLENYYPELEVDLHFRYDEKKDSLLIELSEDSFYETREFDQTVKYFWMKVSPVLFSNH